MLPGLSINVKKLFFFANGSTVALGDRYRMPLFFCGANASVCLPLPLPLPHPEHSVISYMPRATVNQHCMTERWWNRSFIRDHPARAAWVPHLTLHCSVCGLWTKMNLKLCKARWIALVTEKWPRLLFSVMWNEKTVLFLVPCFRSTQQWPISNMGMSCVLLSQHSCIKDKDVFGALLFHLQSCIFSFRENGGP